MQFSSIEDQVCHPKYCLGIFLDYNFSSDKLSDKLTKFIGHFRNLAVLSDRPAVFAKTVLLVLDKYFNIKLADIGITLGQQNFLMASHYR